MNSGKKVVLGFASAMTLTCALGIGAVVQDMRQNRAAELSDAKSSLCGIFGAEAVTDGRHGYTYADALSLYETGESNPSFTVCVQPAYVYPSLSIYFTAQNDPASLVSEDVVIVGVNADGDRVKNHIRNWQRDNWKTGYSPEIAERAAAGLPVAQTLGNDGSGKFARPSPNDVRDAAPKLSQSLLAKIDAYGKK